MKEETAAKPKSGGSEPYRVRLPSFIKDEEIGLGTAIKRVTYALGIKPCEGCNKRAEALNRWVVFHR